RRYVGAHSDGHELRPARQESRRHLCKRIVKLRSHLGMIVTRESPVANVADNTHHFVRRFAFHVSLARLRARHLGNPKGFSDSVLSWESILCQDFIYDDDWFAAGAIIAVEETAFD